MGMQPKPAAKAYVPPGGVSGGAASAGAPKTIGGAAGGAASAQLQAQLQEMKLQNDTLDKERDFYFSKLRDIEMLLQARNLEEGPGKELGQDVLKILYAAEEEKVDVGQGGELTITGPDGNAVTTAPDDVPANDPVDAGNPDEEMN